ncbi:MAG: EAL domain-containing protein [Candidatus Dormiibacterota bacterium]
MLAWASALAATVLAATLALILMARALDRGRARAAHRDQEVEAIAARLRSVIDSVAEPILIVDGDGQVSLANRAASQLFTADVQELAGCHVEQLMPTFRTGTDERAAIGHPQTASARGAEPAPGSHDEITAFRRNGTAFQAKVDSAAIASGGARIVVIRDLSSTPAPSPPLPSQALHDALTGLPGERQLKEQLAARLESASARKVPFSLFLLDLDGFAGINERFGHHLGDRLLEAVADRLRQTLRTTDLIVRLGGDDFAVIPGGGTTPASSARIARQLLAPFKETFIVDGRQVEASASLGIANYPDHGSDPEALMAHAETARVAAKQARRGWVLYRAEDDDAEVEDRAVRLTELRRALDNQELELFYQPVVRVTDSALMALDATVRWRHRRLGLLEPDQFVRAAEQTEIIRPLTRAILGLAIEQQAAWRDQGHALRVAIKLAGRNAQDRQLPRALGALLERWSVPATAVSVTIDENTSLAAETPVLGVLADSGHILGIDNYGSDSTSLLRLRGLPFSELGLDASVVATVRDEGGDIATVRGILELAHALGLTVIARGVDDEVTLTALQRLGCDAAQGRLWGEPVPAGAVIPLLRLLARQSRFPGLGRYRPGEPNPAGVTGTPRS